MKNKIHKVIISFGIILLVLFVGEIVLLRLTIFQNHFNDKEFNRDIWLEFYGSTDSDNPRGQMFTNLNEEYLSKGMTKEEVTDLLGEPDYAKTESIYKYNLGAWSGMRIDYDSLDIEFDAQGKLVNSRRSQH